MQGSILLACSVLVALGVGVLLAYGICAGLFQLFHMHATQAAESRSRARASLGEAVQMTTLKG